MNRPLFALLVTVTSAAWTASAAVVDRDTGSIVGSHAPDTTLVCGDAPGAQGEPNGLGLGGTCATFFGLEPGTEIHITSQTIAGTPTPLFVAGFDVDRDGCLGCTRDDLLWRGAEVSIFAGGSRAADVDVVIYPDAGSSTGEARAWTGFYETTAFAPDAGPCGGRGGAGCGSAVEAGTLPGRPYVRVSL